MFNCIHGLWSPQVRVQYPELDATAHQMLAANWALREWMMQVGSCESPAFNCCRTYKLMLSQTIRQEHWCASLLLHALPSRYPAIRWTGQCGGFCLQLSRLWKQQSGKLTRMKLTSAVNSEHAHARRCYTNRAGAASCRSKVIASGQLLPDTVFV